MHSVHHQVRDPTALSILLIHPLDTLVQQAAPMTLAALLVRPPLAGFYPFTCFHLAESLRAMGDAAAALPLLRRAVEGFEKAHTVGKDHLYCRSAALGLIDCFEALERFDEADAFEEKFFGLGD